MENFLLPMLIQLFAEGEDEDIETPTEEVEDDEESEEDLEDDAEFEDDEESEDEAEELEEPKETKVKETSKQQKSENYKNALKRIEEKKQRELEKAKQESYMQGVKESTGGMNHFTNTKIEDEHDVEMFKIMCEMKKQGLDPIDDLPQYLIKQQRLKAQEVAKAQEAEQATKQRRTNEINDFVKSYGTETVEKTLYDDDFNQYAKPFLDKIPIKEVYENYLSYKSAIEARAEELALEKDARRKASPGSLGNKEKKEKSFADMTPEEFHKFSVGIANKY